MSTLKPRTAAIPIYHGDDLERLADLRRTADAAARNDAPNRLGDESPAQAAREAYDAFVDEAAERAVEVRVQALGRRAFRELMAEHPPREDNEDDAAYDVNVDTFPYAFLPASITEPTWSAEDLEMLSEGDFERLFAAAYWLNRGPGTDPKESRYSAARQTSSAT